MPDLEWDDAKRNRTLADRGLDFADAASIDWETALTAEDDRAAYPERRFVTVASIHNRLCVVAWRWRSQGERQRKKTS